MPGDDVKQALPKRDGRSKPRGHVVCPGDPMPNHEYRVRPAPDRAAKTRDKDDDGYARALADALNAEARQGWEFVRAETLPMRERVGLTGSRMGFRTLLVFRRPREGRDHDATRAALKLLENRTDSAV